METDEAGALQGLCSCSPCLNSTVDFTGLRNPGQCRAGQFYKQLQKNLSHTLEAHASEPSDLKEVAQGEE